MTKEYIATRPATVDDIPAIIQMHRALADECEYPRFLRTIPEDRVAKAIEDPASHSRYFVADDYFLDGYQDMVAEFREIAGFVHTGESPMAWNGQRGIYVDDLYVRPELNRNYPIGTSLLARAALASIEHADGNPDRAFVRIDLGHNTNDATLGAYEGFDGLNTTNLRLEGRILKELAGNAFSLPGQRVSLGAVPPIQ